VSNELKGSEWANLRAPTAEDIEALAETTYRRLPKGFQKLCDHLVIQVADFPDEDTLEEMEIESEFELLGLFRGRGLAQGAGLAETGTLPNMIFLYRRPLLDFWCEGEETLARVVAHVLIHEIGHHFGLSDADMEAIEAQSD
jgi:predicted Zn-dependent protease with MMP-like domain